MNPFLLAGLYDNKEAEQSYKAILKEKYLHSQENRAQSEFDESKRSLLYAQAHRVAVLHPDSEMELVSNSNTTKSFVTLLSNTHRLPVNIKLIVNTSSSISSPNKLP
ncbi:TPA: hypothetical protein JA361_02300 [Legionella pneumophila]|nr:hypothetical protein [Legionella pneumophila]HAT8182288.1 hypothetical protein [Legionella pneumophila]